MSKEPPALSPATPTAIRRMVVSGDLAELSGSAITVWLAITSSSDTSIPIDQISRQVGLSDRQVKRSLQSLMDAGYLSITKAGRRNVYRVLAGAGA